MGGHMQMMMENHMRMTDLRPATPEDETRAHDILENCAARSRAIATIKWRSHRGCGSSCRKFRRTFIISPISPRPAASTKGALISRIQGSLLYAKNADGGYTLVGAMYSAAPDATPDDLDAIVPLSVARWHVHTNICLPADLTLDDILHNNLGADRADEPGMLPVSASPNALELNHRYGFLADGRFGFEGKISDAGQCTAAGGHLVQQAFGWMVHVYPFAGDDLKVAYGMDVPKPTTVSTNASR